MLQRLITALTHLVTRTFFRRIDVVGIENIPTDGPVVFAGNHPNALMDGWLLTATCGRWPLHFVVNAKLWQYRLLVPLLNASGAVPVYRREEHAGPVNNEQAFATLFEVIESGKCMGIFPEGVSHTESRLIKLKTGAARIALTVSARGNTTVTMVPCGLNYLHRHRFRSQVLIEYGEPLVIDAAWVAKYRRNQKGTIDELTETLAAALTAVTLNAPDWRTLRFVQATRRLYKPSGARLSPAQYIELNRRFLGQYDLALNNAELQTFQRDVEDYQAHLDMLGLKDYQLRQSITPAQLLRKILFRATWMLLLLPFAIPGAILHLPIGWIAAAVGERFSYEMDDVATLKVFATILLLPLLYAVVAALIGMSYGIVWALLAVAGLVLSFSASVRLIEAQVGILVSIVSLTRVARLANEIRDLRKTRSSLVKRIRELVEKYSDADTPRMFTDADFQKTTD